MSPETIHDSPFSALGLEAQMRLNNHPHVMLFVVDEEITFECDPGARIIDPDDDSLAYDDIIPHLAEENRLEPIEGRKQFAFWTDNAWNAISFIKDCMQWQIAVIRDSKVDFRILDNRIVLGGPPPGKD